MLGGLWWGAKLLLGHWRGLNNCLKCCRDVPAAATLRNAKTIHFAVGFATHWGNVSNCLVPQNLLFHWFCEFQYFWRFRVSARKCLWMDFVFSRKFS